MKHEIRYGPWIIPVVYKAVEEYHGWWDGATGTILIDPDMGEPDRSITLLHEIIHMIWDRKSLEGAPEETIASVVSADLVQIRQDNEWLRDLI